MLVAQIEIGAKNNGRETLKLGGELPTAPAGIYRYWKMLVWRTWAMVVAAAW